MHPIDTKIEKILPHITTRERLSWMKNSFSHDRIFLVIINIFSPTWNVIIIHFTLSRFIISH